MDVTWKNKGIYCGNCGKYGHIFKKCKEPTTSLGVIGIRVEEGSIMDKVKKVLAKNDVKLNTYTHGITFTNPEDIKLFSQYKDSIKFLMVRRKHTVGYMQFIRGGYRVDNIDGIIFLFHQMTKDEISNIAKKEFDELWKELWSETQTNLSYFAEYKSAKDKFYLLKNNEDLDLNLNFYIENVNPIWTDSEWGFAKGRRNLHELDITCATREFEEETGLNKNDYTVMKNIEPIEEEFIGTNGIRYKHIYYISLIDTDKKITVDENNKFQKDEIGDIGLFTFDDAIKLVRPYHVKRKELLTATYMCLMDVLIRVLK